MNTIYTIGHSTRSYEELLAMLRSFNIEVLADVRHYPGSARYPHFNKEALEKALPVEGIEYIHFKGLGGRRKAHKDSHNNAWRSEAFKGYADYMETPAFSENIDALVKLAAQKKTAYMCSEAVWWRCHRALVSDYLKVTGRTVLHIMAVGKADEHPYTGAATITNGKLVYQKTDPPQTGLLF
jgi:uncharacterized protein (DUF488 family)